MADTKKPPSDPGGIIVTNAIILRRLAEARGHAAPASLTEVDLGEVLVELSRAKGDLDALKQEMGTDRPRTLDAAADLLLAMMEPAHQDQVRQVADEHSWPVWVLLLGSTARVADQMELHACEMNPDWLNAPRGARPADKTVMCEFSGCGWLIPHPNRGQRFCCSAHGSDKPWHSDGCPVAVANGLPQGIPAEVVLERLTRAKAQQQQIHAGRTDDEDL